MLPKTRLYSAEVKSSLVLAIARAQPLPIGYATGFFGGLCSCNLDLNDIPESI